VGQLFVLDNSVVMSWCFEDESNNYADSVLEKLTTAQAIVPAIWALEVVNVLLVAERRDRIKQSDSTSFLTLLMQLPIEIKQDMHCAAMSELLFLGRSHNLSSYDLAYLNLALHNGCPLATMDQKLIEAAEDTGVLLLE
jgi:predicted nucleic acid-binding protein